jgi:hypothetical protein
MDSIKRLDLSHCKKLKTRLDKIKKEECKLVPFDFNDEMKKLRKKDRDRQKRYRSWLGWFWRSHDWCYWTFWSVVRSNPWKETNWFLQRGKRGWSDCDAWGACNHLARVISDITKYLTTCYTGVPSEFKNIKEWHAVLKKISVAFDLLDKKDRFSPGIWKRNPKLAKQCDVMTHDESLLVEEGWRLFKKYFNCLWD